MVNLAMADSVSAKTKVKERPSGRFFISSTILSTKEVRIEVP